MVEQDAVGYWPEQEAVEKWFAKHSRELKKAVTERRIREQEHCAELEEELKRLREALEKIAGDGWQDYKTDREAYSGEIMAEIAKQALK